MKVTDILKKPTKVEALKSLRANIKDKSKENNPEEADNDVKGWNQDMHAGAVPGALLYR